MANSSAARQVLEDELRLVLEQKVAIQARLTQLQSAPGRQTGPLAVKTGAGKRPPNAPSKTHVPPTKKQKVDDRQRRFASLWNQMSTVLKQIMKQRDAAHFSQPVDIEKLKVPDYYKIVKVPMDLGTVKQNLEHRPDKGQPRKYGTPAEFCRDVRQVWANCRMYNPEGHQVRGMGDRLSDAWEKKWLSSQIEEKWEALKREEKEDELGPAIVPHRLKEMSAELQELNGKVAAGAPPRGDGPRATFSFEDKRRLSQHLGALPGNKLNRVLEIIAEAMELPTNEDGELELDIDALSEKTLVALDEYVGSVIDEAQDKYDKGKAAATSNKGRGEVLQQGQTAEQLAAAAQPAAGGAASQPDVADAAAAAVGGSGSGLDPPGALQQPPAQSAGGDGAAAAPAEAASAPAQPSPTSSSSDGSSSSSDDDSMGEVGSKHDGDSAEGGAKGVEAGAEQSTLVSATHPQQAPGIYQQKSRKDVTLQNEGAWGALAAAKPATPATAAAPAAAPDGTAPAAAADGAGGAAASAEPGADADDPVWSEFARREQQQKKLAQEKAAEEKARLTAQEQAEEAARKEAAARQAEAAAAAEAERKKAAEAEAAAAAAAEARRKEELAALDAGATDLAGPQDVIGNNTAGNALNALGLKQQDSSSDDSDSD